ncbi:hypothetical protein GWE18_15305 [Bradyrhizobium sp. CSA112]|uniref:hypothetical protein n=1 Tax=Bradyrhizobium sp. CSA112 TaxID=2699170 RepID=UPI0023AF73FB|nr:hypothetical protein [Bradyrhizobium sp. CSA112]MDE5454188.1 hypothetical protein [Bradyrhizobium sp. CSA112]
MIYVKKIGWRYLHWRGCQIFPIMIERRPSGFIEPCQPSKVARPPSGPSWVHEIKHDGYRLMVRRDGARHPDRFSR